MNARSYPEEVRDAWIAELTPIHAAAIRHDIASGGPTLALIADRWSSMLADDTLAQQLVRASVALEPRVAGACVRTLVEQIIAEVAGERAEAEADQVEIGRKQSADDTRVERGVWHRAMCQLPELTTN